MSATPVQPTTYVDQEEPFVLSDVVRSGEASRLRRRGAIALNHGSRPRENTDAQSAWTRPPLGPAQVVVPQAPWTDGAPATPMPAAYPPWDDWDQAKAEEADGRHGSGYELYCGFEEWDFSTDEPYEASPLPAYPPQPRTAQRSPHRYRKSTGCGALIHKSGTPRTRCGTWQAKGKATSVVVPLDKSYFDRGGQTRHFACGCRWYGVGCSICGNALGNIYIPCQAAAASSFANGPGRRPADGAHFIYTFFCTATSSSPSFTFPESCPPPPSMAMPLFSASPEPMLPGETEAEGDVYEEREQEQEQDELNESGMQEPGAELDPDGVYIAGAPSSPDKPANEMLWPAR